MSAQNELVFDANELKTNSRNAQKTAPCVETDSNSRLERHWQVGNRDICVFCALA